jgi:hypothetical protein
MLSQRRIRGSRRTRRTLRISQYHNSRIFPINNINIISRISQMPIPQITNNPFENDFFNGTNFQETNGLESLILPAGCGSSSFF